MCECKLIEGVSLWRWRFEEWAGEERGRVCDGVRGVVVVILVGGG